MMFKSFLGFMTDQEQSESRLPDVWSKILSSALITSFYLTRATNKTKQIHTTLTLLLYFLSKNSTQGVVLTFPTL